MTTVAAISKDAFDAVAAAITDAVLTVTVTRTTRGAYDTATGAYATTTADDAGRAVLDTVKPIADVFAGYVAGPRDQLFLIEGAASVREGDTMTVGVKTYGIGKTQDILGAGGLFYAVAQEVV